MGMLIVSRKVEIGLVDSEPMVSERRKEGSEEEKALTSLSQCWSNDDERDFLFTLSREVGTLVLDWPFEWMGTGVKPKKLFVIVVVVDGSVGWSKEESKCKNRLTSLRSFPSF
jgi:hypothetical protein